MIPTSEILSPIPEGDWHDHTKWPTSEYEPPIDHLDHQQKKWWAWFQKLPFARQIQAIGVAFLHRDRSEDGQSQ